MGTREQTAGAGQSRGSSARRHLLRLIEARHSFLAGDIERAVSVYADLLGPTGPNGAHPVVRLDLRRILLHLDQMAAADPEFGLARRPLRDRLLDLLAEGD